MNYTYLITTCNSSCGKVMFSHASVSHSVHGGWVSLVVPDPFWGSWYAWSQVSSRSRYVWYQLPFGGLGYVQGWVCPVCEMSRRGSMSKGEVNTHPPWPLTPSGSYHMYGCQAGSTHPTGMLSCFSSFFICDCKIT